MIKYRNYKKNNNNLFRNDLLNKLLLKNVQSKHFDTFNTTTQQIFDRNAPLKVKHVRYYQDTFVNKKLRKAIMKR